MKNPFKKIGSFFKQVGKGALAVVKSDIAREIAAAAFTVGGLPRISAAIRTVDAAVEKGERLDTLRAQLIDRAIKNPEETAVILGIIQEFEKRAAAD